MQQNRHRQVTTRSTGSSTAVSFLPSFCSIRAVFAVVISAELLAMIITLASIDRLSDFIQALSIVSLLVQWIALSTAALLCLLRGWLKRQSNQLAAVLAWGLLLVVTALVCEFALWLNGQVGLHPSWVEHRELLVKALAISMLVGFVVVHYLYLEYRWRQQVEAENSARLQALHSRIRPHFLFNSMNTIASLTHTDPAMAEEVVLDLADLFRVSLGDVSRQSSLGRELELARQYLNIEGHRLGERLKVHWDLLDLPESAMMPPMILQPLLENAVYHGIEPAAEGGSIFITGRYRRRRINLSIRNSLPLTTDTTHRKGNQMAIENIRQRLTGLFDLEASLTESLVEGEHQVRLVFPHPWRLE